MKSSYIFEDQKSKLQEYNTTKSNTSYSLPWVTKRTSKNSLW